MVVCDVDRLASWVMISRVRRGVLIVRVHRGVLIVRVHRRVHSRARLVPIVRRD
jgi:hypothetical protein